MEGLKKKSEFSAVYQRGRSAADAYLVLYADGPHLCTENDNPSPARAGISVSKKVGNSVVRHRIKRKLKEICRLREDHFQKGTDYVVIARVKAAEADYRRLEESLLKLVRKLSV